MAEKKGSADEKVLHCSFCNKSQHEVRKLIAGPSVFICDECIDLCNDIILEETQVAARDAIRNELPTPSEIKTFLDGYVRSEEHTSELQSLMRISYAVFCLKKKKRIHN